MTDFARIAKFSSLPENLKKEVEDFIDFLKMKSSPHKTEKKQRILGLAQGKAIIKEGFDDPIEDFKDYM